MKEAFALTTFKEKVILVGVNTDARVTMCGDSQSCLSGHSSVFISKSCLFQQFPYKLAVRNDVKLFISRMQPGGL